MAELEATPTAPALVLLTKRFGLSPFERDVLLLCIAMDLDTRTAGLCASAQGDPTTRFPTFALALTLFENPAWEALAPDRPLRFWRLIEVRGGPLEPLTTSPLLADERIVNYCKGLNTPDGRLAELFVPFAFSAPDVSDVAPSQRPQLELIVRRLTGEGDTAPPIIHLIGPDRASKQALAQGVADRFRLPLVRLPVESLPTSLTELEELLRLLRRESALLPVALYVDAYDANVSTEGAPPSVNLNRVLGQRAGVTLLDTRDVVPGVELDTLLIEVQSPTPAEQRDAWATALGLPAEGLPSRLAGQFDLSSPLIARIGRIVRATSDGSEADDEQRAWAECLGHVRPQLDRLAERIEPQFSWDDLILPAEEKDLLRRIADQVRQRSTVYHEWGVGDETSRGLGITALFAGESGTGKTMAAEVLARELNLNLYRIDLSAVVSKYIGETEKNLRRVFDASDNGGTMLLFDEADALFGKRTEVKDSHDRYANIEINYLLQRMEAYRGLAVLATNMKGALDQAFTRRLRFIVTFPFPGPAERELIWRQAFGKGVPIEDLDYARLAKLNLAGGSIHNVAMNATFLAAASPDQRVSMATILSAARMELRKMNRPFNEAELDAGAGDQK
jgi:SpoVK/Ycf46/Vps4 family AAA+-type ATPase